MVKRISVCKKYIVIICIELFNIGKGIVVYIWLMGSEWRLKLRG